ncbi:MAG: hypothetical protein KBD37_03205 [Burkholderiales bacterium]|nr:hypothetical protein [Burkholderiales bacterium]
MYIDYVKCNQINRNIDNRELANRFIDKLDLCPQHFRNNIQLEYDYDEHMMNIDISAAKSAWGFGIN